METKCKRCGKKIPEKHYMIQVIVYLSNKHYPRHSICKECYESFIEWFDEVEDNKDG